MTEVTQIMRDDQKTREQLLRELQSLWRRIETSREADEDLGRTRSKERNLARAFLEVSIPMGITTMGKGRFVEVNRAFLETMGAKQEEVLGNTSVGMGLITEEQRSALYAEFLLKGRVENLELEVRGKRGDRIRGLFNATEIQLDGEDYLLTVMTDITALTMAEAALRESEERYRTIIESIGDGYNEVDPRGNFTFFNESFRKILGYEREELLGMNYRLCTDPSNAEKIFRAYNRVWTTGESLDRFEWGIIRKDGVRRNIEVSVSLIREQTGRITGFGGIARDVTDRKEAEAALRESEADYRSIFENSIMGIYRSTPDGRYITVNKAFSRIFGYASPEEILHSVMDIGNQMYANSEDRSRVLAMLEVEQRAVVEICIRRRDGTIGRILNNVRIVRNDDGGIRYYEGFIQDITDLKRAEEALQKTLLEMESRVQERTLDLKEANTALRVLISRRAEDQRQLEERLQMNVNDLIFPILEEIKSICLDKRSAGYLSLLESNLKDITSPFLNGLQATYRNLTAREIQVAAMIRDGKKTKEISELLEVSPVTVETHRNHIRTKLGLVNGKTNLRSYLLSIK